MGNDFNYGDAGKWYRNLDKLIKYANKVFCMHHHRLLYYPNLLALYRMDQLM